MLKVHTEPFDNFFKDPVIPSWSSYALEQAIQGITEKPSLRLVLALEVVDSHLDRSDVSLTEIQSNFIRAITIFNYTAKEVLSYGQLTWLVDRFKFSPSTQRALLLLFLVSEEDMGEELYAKAKSLLVGTPGEEWGF